MKALPDPLLASLRDAMRPIVEDREAVRAAARAVRVKAGLFVAWFMASYSLILCGESAGVILVGSISTGLALAGLAFNVQHEAAHNAIPEGAAVNRVGALLLDWLGMSSYLWKWKHNVLHHGHPNVFGVDDDVDAGWFLRIHPEARWRSIHRWQHFYAWPLYSLVTLRWIFVSDLREYVTGRIGSYVIPPMSRADKFRFWLGKALFVGWAVGLPAIIHGPGTGVLVFLVFETTGGLVSAVVFQLAHAVEQAEHPSSALRSGSWSSRQLATTVDFDCPWIGWYLGGLNRQAVHHLFPSMSHYWYDQIAALLRTHASAHGASYRSSPSILIQIRSHYRLLRRLGSAVADAKRH